ncbi:hypothetical protein MMC30_007337 [Trapelia coarctata]|nr:hypothetical protein [Trapelia coarctata]
MSLEDFLDRSDAKTVADEFLWKELQDLAVHEQPWLERAHVTAKERKQANTRAQSKLRERRTEYIGQLEKAVKDRNETLQNEQQNYRSTTNDLLMLRYSQSFLERVLFEKGVNVKAELEAMAHLTPTAAQDDSKQESPQEQQQSQEQRQWELHYQQLEKEYAEDAVMSDNEEDSLIGSVVYSCPRPHHNPSQSEGQLCQTGSQSPQEQQQSQEQRQWELHYQQLEKEYAEDAVISDDEEDSSIGSVVYSCPRPHHNQSQSEGQLCQAGSQIPIQPSVIKQPGGLEKNMFTTGSKVPYADQFGVSTNLTTQPHDLGTHMFARDPQVLDIDMRSSNALCDSEGHSKRIASYVEAGRAAGVLKF